MKFDKVPLQYKYRDLQPWIDKETVCIHYTKHLQTYVDKLNKALEGYENFTDGKSLEEILYYPELIPKEIKKDVINQGGGVANHNLYFSILAKKPKKCPEGKLLNEINKKFGSLENLKDEISKKAINQFGSGYAWLVINENGELEVMATANQDSPLIFKKIPILTIDVWEHAYYLKYKNLRADYVQNIWNVIDWSKVEEIYLSENNY
ncbi:superoxide dismutase [Clostridium sp.]|uniref:superoxide dismutase n=1 Tax=Clostridium sp. TaxID=1506 RepID=UPI003F3AD762